MFNRAGGVKNLPGKHCGHVLETPLELDRYSRPSPQKKIFFGGEERLYTCRLVTSMFFAFYFNIIMANKKRSIET